jgi:hypothetical protein
MSPETVRFLAALAPARSDEAARERVMSLRSIDTPDWIGVARDGAAGEQLLFRKGADARPGGFNSWTTDAAAWFVRGTSGKTRLLAGLGATTLKHGSESWFASQRPASFAVVYENGRVALNVYSAVAQTVQWRRPDGRMAQVKVEAGSQEFEWPGERKP